jgi:hypothetical protein
MTHSLSYRRVLTRMGYYNYQNGLIFRHMNQDGGWGDHLENSRRYIMKALDLYNPEKITVLGSGWLLDLPFAELVERTKKICLVDIVHPPEVLKQAGSFKNVEFIEQDVTGGLISEVWEKMHKFNFLIKAQTLDNITIPDYNPVVDPGMVISLNILTQLETQLVDFIRKRSGISEEEFNFFRSEIQKKHLLFLLKHKSVIISDYAEVITDRTGSVKTIPTVFTDLSSFRLREEWMWNFDQTGADMYNSRSQLKVVALLN